MSIKNLSLVMVATVPMILSLSTPSFAQDEPGWQQVMEQQAERDAEQQARAQAEADREAQQQAQAQAQADREAQQQAQAEREAEQQAQAQAQAEREAQQQAQAERDAEPSKLCKTNKTNENSGATSDDSVVTNQWE